MTLTGTTRRDARAAQTRWRMPWTSALLGLVAFVGVLVMLYPTTAAWVSQYYQSQLIRTVESEIRTAPSTEIQQALADARSYNDALVSGALVGADSRVPTSSGTSSSGLDYQNLLRADAAGAMGRLRIPAISVDLPIYHGTTDDVLAKGVGHLEGTSLPIGGTSQHSVLTAHRGLASATLFDNLDQLVQGDTFTIEIFGEVLTYRVRDTQIVEPEQTQSLYPVYGEDLVTLVTCTPLGINTHRILVTGERVTPTPPEDVAGAGQSPDIPGFPWWIVADAAALAALIGLIWITGRPPRRVTHQ